MIKEVVNNELNTAKFKGKPVFPIVSVFNLYNIFIKY